MNYCTQNSITTKELLDDIKQLTTNLKKGDVGYKSAIVQDMEFLLARSKKQPAQYIVKSEDSIPTDIQDGDIVSQKLSRANL